MRKTLTALMLAATLPTLAMAATPAATDAPPPPAHMMDGHMKDGHGPRGGWNGPFKALNLSPEQRQAALFDAESGPWRAWHNMHVFMMRHGASLNDMSETQRERCLDILRASLSAAGYTLARDIMKLNEHINEICGKPGEYGEWYYWMSIMGTPSATEPWGWQIDGHHLIINCFILGDQIVLTPEFLGSEPVEAKFGKYQGTRVFAHAPEYLIAKNF